MRSSNKFLILISLLGLFYVIPMTYAQNTQYKLVVTPNTLETALLPGASISETKEVDGRFENPMTGEIEYAYFGFLEVKTTPGYEAWLTSVNPPEYFDVNTPAPAYPNYWPYTFEITITVPASIIPGVYEFDVIFYTHDWGTPTTVEAHESVKITVLPSYVVPELPFGTVSGILVMLAATGLMTMRK